jgi:two-component system, cell cycle response regulator DivK
MTKVLYVEHNDDNLYMLKTRLELLGDFQVLAAEESEKGRNLAVKEHPDVILMDLEMPDADCWEVVRRLKNDAQTGHIPIIGMSAYVVASERQKAIATAATSSKPNRSSSSLWSPPFGASLRTRNNSPTVLVRLARRPANAP